MYISAMKQAKSRSVSYSFKKITSVLLQYGIDQVVICNIPGLVFEFECSDPVLIQRITTHIKLACGSKFSFTKSYTSFFTDNKLSTEIFNIK
jgi:hypothetical protein